MTRTWPVASVGFALVWVFVRGVTLTPAGILGQFLLGLVVGIPIAYLFRRLYEEEVHVRRSPRIVLAFARYLLSFVWEVIVANVDVAYRVLAPRRAIEPQIILLPLRVQTALGITTIANSITLTPGTITLDYDHELNALYVHIIDGRNPEAVVDPIRNWEDHALVIFDEPLPPGEAAPDITVHPPVEELPATVRPALERHREGGDEDDS